MEVYLRTHGYDFDTIPFDYIREPPANLASVKKNLKLIEEILDPKESKHSSKEFIQELAKEIYAKVDEFVAKLEAVLNDHNATSPILDRIGLRKRLSGYLQSQEEEMNVQGMKAAETLIKDVEYLRQMKVLETEESAGKDIVPITGLIIGRFCRLRNELKTVLSIWGKSSEEDESSSKTLKYASVSWSKACKIELLGETLEELGVETKEPDEHSPYIIGYRTKSVKVGGEEEVSKAFEKLRNSPAVQRNSERQTLATPATAPLISPRFALSTSPR
jgi:hypothetical protein